MTVPADEAIHNRIHPDDQQRVRDALENAVTNDQAYHVDFRHQTPDGYRWVESHGDINYTEEGLPRVIGIVTDISDHKARQQELERYEELIETLPIGYVRTTMDGEFVDMNSTFLELVGAESQDEVMRRAVPEFYRDPTTREKLVEKLQETGRVVDQEVKVTTLLGEIIWVSITAQLVGQAESAYADAIVQDVTPRKERQRELERYETILEASGDAVYTLDADGCMTFVNEAFCELVGYCEEELLGEYVSIVLDEEDIERSEVVIRNLLRTDRDRQTLELDLIQADDIRVACETHIALLPFDEEGEFRGTTGIHRDITERKHRERELQQKNQQLEDFASIVSHDLRNPLNVAAGRVELAMAECDSEYLDGVIDAHERMEELIEDLLYLAREGETIQDLEPVDLRDIAENCWKNVATDSAKFSVESDRTLLADRGRLQQLLENLLRNAVEHGGKDVTVTIDLLTGEEGFYIEDDGPGMNASDLEKSDQASHYVVEQSTGLGLSIVEEIARAHDWEVGFTDSTSRGARIEFTGVDIVEAS